MENVLQPLRQLYGKPIIINSAFRSIVVNNAVKGAKNSQHLCGKAADIMIPERTMKQVQQAAKSLRAGGVGRYSQFVHVDTGHVRYWGPA